MSGEKMESDSSSCAQDAAVTTVFDRVDVRHTRPGFGVLAMLKPGQQVHKIRDACASQFLLMKSRDEAMHMTVFQVFMEFDPETYRHDTLPNNILHTFRDFIYDAVSDDLDKLKADLDKLRLTLTGEWIVIGRVYPSHIALVAECRDLAEAIKKLQVKCTLAAQTFMGALVCQMSRENKKSVMVNEKSGTTLRGDGWSITIGYTERTDYKMHITIGMLPTGDPDVDLRILQLNANAGREIDPKFRMGRPDRKIEALKKQVDADLIMVQKRKLLELDPQNLTEYSELRSQVELAHADKPVDVHAGVVNEWGRYEMSKIGDRLRSMLPQKLLDFAEGDGESAEPDADPRAVYVSEFSGGIIDTYRIPNFEAATPELEPEVYEDAK